MGIQEPFRIRNGLEVSNNALIVKSSNLNVGIGTFTPQYNLDVLGNINYTGIFYRNGIPVEFGGGSGGTNYWNSNNVGIYTYGAVGIGTNIPTSSLTVFGNVLVSGISGIVTANKFFGDGSGLTGIAATSGVSTYAQVAGVSTVSQGLTGIPNLNVGIVTAIQFIGDGSGLTNLPITGGDSYWVKNITGIHTLSNIGIGTTTVLSAITIGSTTGITFTDTNVKIGNEYTGTNIVAGSNNNNFIGWYAGGQGEAYYSNFFGYHSGGGTSGIGCCNNLIGYCAGYLSSGGQNNNFFGSYTGYNNSGDDNNFLGQCAGYSNTSGSYNNFLGHLAGHYNTDGSCNNFFGYRSGHSNTTGSYNISIGTDTFGATTGCGNLLMGYSAGYAGMDDSSYNNFIGWYAGGCGNQGLSCYNNFLGYNSGGCNSDGCYNNFFGHYSGYLNNSGQNNNFFGKSAGYKNSGDNNNFIGNESGYNNGTGGSNSFIGECSGYSNTTGNYNLYFGSNSGISTTRSHKIVIGSSNSSVNRFDSPNTQKSKQFAIGLNTTGTSEYWLVGDENLNVGIGTTSPTSKLTVVGDVLVSGTGIVTTTSIDVTGTTRIKNFTETQSTSTISSNILDIDASQGTVFTHTTSSQIGIVSFRGISTVRANDQTLTVLITQGNPPVNTTGATGIGTQLATIVTDTGVGITTHIKVGSGVTMTLTNNVGALDLISFIICYNGLGITTSNFTVIGIAATDFRGTI